MARLTESATDGEGAHWASVKTQHVSHRQRTKTTKDAAEVSERRLCLKPCCSKAMQDQS